MKNEFENRLQKLRDDYDHLIGLANRPDPDSNGVYTRYANPVLTARHTPVFWRYDLDKETNPLLMERFSVNAVLNAGAIKLNGKYFLVARVEAANRKSFFAVAESSNGIDNFKFWDYPVQMPETENAETNIYDMRLVQHEDGWIYGLFCTERKDPSVSEGDQSSAVAQCGIARTKDLKKWERLADLKTPSPQQRNVVLHPELIEGKYAFYTRPQDSFIEAGNGGGIALGLSSSIENAVVSEEVLIDRKIYHTVFELKNGAGPAPIKTEQGWLHLAHGVRNTAAGLRYVLYMFMTDIKDITKVTHKPSGYFMAPEGEERIGDVSNVLFSNGWITDDDGTVYIYYASSDTRMHVSKSSIAQLLDYVMHTPVDGYTSATTVRTLNSIIEKNFTIQSKTSKEITQTVLQSTVPKDHLVK